MLPIEFVYFINCHQTRTYKMDKPEQPDYELFKKWFTENGGLYNKVVFPYKFDPIGYIGVAAATQIKANQAIVAIPKKIIISVTKVRESELGPILKNYNSLSDMEDQQTEFNILTLYLIYHKMLQKNSPYYPYLQSIQKSQTIIQWCDEDIKKMNDPYITVDLVNQLREQFPIIYNDFLLLSKENKQLFKSEITMDVFMECYTIVMTRCFGWGLPETMLVPFADLFNHHCHGVHHYTFNRELQNKNSGSYTKQYVKKRKQIDLRLLNIDNTKQLPISYAPNRRQQFIECHKKLLPQQLAFFSGEHLMTKKTKKQLECIQDKLLLESFDVDMYPSSNSQDNDSQQDIVEDFEFQQKFYTKKLKRLSRQQLQHNFQEPKPLANRQFEDDTNFEWWYKMPEQDSYFIVTTHRHIDKNQQIYNSYGRRSNRFLLIWYGFTHFNNKYDSVCFRLWDEKIYHKNGKLIFVKYVSQKSWMEAVREGETDVSNLNITDQYRLKRDNLCYQLLSYLRLRIARRSPTLKPLLTKSLLSIYKITNLDLQTQTLEYYSLVLSHLAKQYNIHLQRQRLSCKNRDYFASLLISSNEEIIYNHMKGIEYLKKVIEFVKKGQKIEDVYKWNIGVGEGEAKGEQEKAVFLTNRKFVLGYLKMLDKFQKRSKK